MLYEKEEIKQAIAARFGGELLTDGSIDRLRLGDIVFRDGAKREELEGIIYPALREDMRLLQAKAESHEAVALFFDIPLLFEKGWTGGYDAIWVVYATPRQQLERTMERNSLSSEQVQARIAAQMPLEEKRALASVVIDNTGSWAETEVQLAVLAEALMRF
jgi:dephospho-CoA kinase